MFTDNVCFLQKYLILQYCHSDEGDWQQGNDPSAGFNDLLMKLSYIQIQVGRQVQVQVQVTAAQKKKQADIVTKPMFENSITALLNFLCRCLGIKSTLVKVRERSWVSLIQKKSAVTHLSTFNQNHD